MQLNQASFFKVFKNENLRKVIFSYLPLFVLTPRSVNYLGSSLYEGYYDIGYLTTVGILPNQTRNSLKPSFRLTTDHSFQTGCMWSKNKVNVINGFIATFSFQIIPTKDNPKCGGMAFVIQSSPSGNNTLYQDQVMGYTGIPNCLAIEFDTLDESRSPNDTHISIQTRGRESNSFEHCYSIGWGIPSKRLDNGETHECIVIYDTKSLSSPTITVKLNGEELFRKVEYDLRNIGLYNDTDAYVGFSASTGDICQFIRILKCEIMEFKPELNMETARLEDKFTQTFLQVFKNTYLRKYIFSYLHLFVLTPQSVNYIGSSIYEILPTNNANTSHYSFDLTTHQRNQTGTLWSKKTIRVVDGFISTFSFQIITEPFHPSGDGLAFIIQSSPTGSETDVSSMGLSGIPNCLALKFNTVNSNDGDGNYGIRVSIQTNGREPNSYQHSYSIGWGITSIPLDNGEIHECVVVYDTKSSTIPTTTLYLNGKLVKRVEYDLRSIGLYNDTNAYVGFSAANGYKPTYHRILQCKIIKY